MAGGAREYAPDDRLLDGDDLGRTIYAMGTSLDRQSYLQDMYKRGHGVGIEAWQFGGFDVIEVYENVKKAVEHARSGQGPVLLEAITYRYRGRDFRLTDVHGQVVKEILA